MPRLRSGTCSTTPGCPRSTRPAGRPTSSGSSAARTRCPSTSSSSLTVADGDLDPKLEAFLRLAIDVSATHLYRPGVRQHIRRALDLGATRAEILEVITLMSVVGIHAPATELPILEEELAGTADAAAVRAPQHPTPVCDWFRSNGQFNPEWELLYR